MRDSCILVKEGGTPRLCKTPWKMESTGLCFVVVAIILLLLRCNKLANFVLLQLT